MQIVDPPAFSFSRMKVLRDHKSTNSLDNFLGNTSFLGKDIVDV